MPVSKKDLLRVNLGRKRVERIKEQALIPWKAKKPIGTTIYDYSQEKPAIVYPDKAIVEVAQGMTSPENKAFRLMRLGGDNRYTGQNGFDHPSHVIKGTTSGRGSRKGK